MNSEVDNRPVYPPFPPPDYKKQIEEWRANFAKNWDGWLDDDIPECRSKIIGREMETYGDFVPEYPRLPEYHFDYQTHIIFPEELRSEPITQEHIEIGKKYMDQLLATTPCEYRIQYFELKLCALFRMSFHIVESDLTIKKTLVNICEKISSGRLIDTP